MEGNSSWTSRAAANHRSHQGDQGVRVEVYTTGSLRLTLPASCDVTEVCQLPPTNHQDCLLRIRIVVLLCIVVHGVQYSTF